MDIIAASLAIEILAKLTAYLLNRYVSATKHIQ
jgi:hypothetical protein